MDRSRLFEQSDGARWGLSPERFEAALEASAARAFENRSPSADQRAEYFRALHLKDLALAAACADGCEAAWDHFVREHRPILYRAAEAIDRSDGARDLADALYADLFGLRERDGQRNSLFRYFHGRSSLNTWLRALLAPLPDEEQMPAQSRGLSGPSAGDPDRPRFSALMARALEAAVASLPARDRLRLACYYAQELTLAQIGTLLHEHEATVSRHLSRARAAIRSSVERCLREDEGLDAAACAECLTMALEDPGSLSLEKLFVPAATPSAAVVTGPSTSLRARKIPDVDRSN
jgi:RNA polymerase sigma-70 factor (ECF subfamily)